MNELKPFKESKEALLKASSSTKNYIFESDGSLTYHDYKSDITVSIIHIEDRKKENTYFQVYLEIAWKKFKHNTKFKYSSKSWFLDTIMTTLSDDKDYCKKLDKLILKPIHKDITENNYNNFERLR